MAEQRSQPHPHHVHWYALMAGLLTLATLAAGGTGIAATVADNHKPPVPFDWVIYPTTILAFCCLPLAAFSFVAAIRGWQFPFAKQQHMMDAEHAAPLRVSASELQASIQGGRASRYFDGGSAENHYKERFRRHFKEMVPFLDEWDSLLVELSQTQTQTANAIPQGARERWGGIVSWMTISQYAWGYVQNNIRQDEPPEPQFVYWEYGDRVQIIQGVNGNGTIIRDYPVPATDSDRQEALQLALDLRAWVVQMHSDEPAATWRGLFARQEEVRNFLVPQLVAVVHSSALARKGRCDKRCREGE